MAIARDYPRAHGGDDLMRLTKRIAKTFYLNPRHHRRCAELPIASGERVAADERIEYGESPDDL